MNQRNNSHLAQEYVTRIVSVLLERKELSKTETKPAGWSPKRRRPGIAR